MKTGKTTIHSLIRDEAKDGAEFKSAPREPMTAHEAPKYEDQPAILAKLIADERR